MARPAHRRAFSKSPTPLLPHVRLAALFRPRINPDRSATPPDAAPGQVLIPLPVLHRKPEASVNGNLLTGPGQAGNSPVPDQGHDLNGYHPQQRRHRAGYPLARAVSGVRSITETCLPGHLAWPGAALLLLARNTWGRLRTNPRNLSGCDPKVSGADVTHFTEVNLVHRPCCAP